MRESEGDSLIAIAALGKPRRIHIFGTRILAFAMLDIAEFSQQARS